MIELCRFDNVNGSSFVFNDNANIAPLREFTTEVDDRFTERQKSQQHGIYPANTLWGKRLFHLTGDLNAPDSATYITRRLAMVNAILPRPQTGTKKAGDLSLLFTGMTETLTSECTLDGYPELPMQALSPGRTSFLINFKSFDPRLYGTWQTTLLQYGIPDNIGGRTYNKTFNKTYSTSGGLGGGSALITNAGNYETYPIIVFHGPVVDPRITLQRSDGTNYYFTLLGLTLANVADTVTVDLASRTVTRWDGSNLYQYSVGSDWFSLEPLPLTQSLIFTGSSGSSPAYASIQWRNAYMI